MNFASPNGAPNVTRPEPEPVGIGHGIMVRANQGGNGVPPNTRAGAQQNQNTAAAGDMPPPADRFHTPRGHYSNPADNVYAATLALCRMPIDQSPQGDEARRAIEMLKTAITQQGNMPDKSGALHSTPYNSRANRSHHGETPRPAGSGVRNGQQNQGHPVPQPQRSGHHQQRPAQNQPVPSLWHKRLSTIQEHGVRRAQTRL